MTKTEEPSSRPTGSGAPGEDVLAELIAQQDAKVLALARRIVPHLTPEDVRNPHDFPALLASPDFNYEDGILAGLRAAQIALRAARRRPPNV